MGDQINRYGTIYKFVNIRYNKYNNSSLEKMEFFQEISGDLETAEKYLHSKHFRIRKEEDWISAEKGYSREFGNVLFRLSLILILIGVSIGSLFGMKGDSIVNVGERFTNIPTNYDSITYGKLFSDKSLPPFVIKLDVNVNATDEETPVHESDEDSFTVQVAPNPPYYIEFPNGELDEDISADESFKPYSKELWPYIIKDYISSQSTIGFVFVCETQITEVETGTVKDALLAQYQGYGGLMVTYCQHFKLDDEENELTFGMTCGLD